MVRKFEHKTIHCPDKMMEVLNTIINIILLCPYPYLISKY